ncbi:hypothetical protein ACFO9E_27495 [Streptomyces maoxianensis]|uniref:Uncharacterized protein n=1 Tax=Streptomyces maoxianensis TaxID=1459942 RepID=A0ABV9GB28_9ACTN
MKDFIAGHQVVTLDDFLELALGTPLELWLGVEGESDEERTARVDAARDILADDPSLFDTVTRLAVETIEVQAPALLNVIPLTPPPARRRRGSRPSGVAA